MKMKKTVCIGYKLVLLLIPLVLSLLSCDGKREYDAMRIVEEWEGKEIIFPDSLSFMRYGIEPVDFSIGTGYKILVYVDSTGCASCKMQLEEWNRFISYVDSVANGSCQYLFFIHTRYPKEMSYVLKNAKFNVPVCIDIDNSLDKINDFPDNILFQTFFLNSENRVVYIGNPVYSSAIQDLYENVLVRDKQKKEEDPKIIVDPAEVNLGSLSLGEEKMAIFELKNNSDELLVIENVSTTCDCASISFDKKPVIVDGSLQVMVTVKPKEIGFFSQTVIVKSNISNFVKLRVVGHVNN